MEHEYVLLFDDGREVIGRIAYPDVPACLTLPVLDAGGWGQLLFFLSGERDTCGRLVFRPRTH